VRTFCSAALAAGLGTLAAGLAAATALPSPASAQGRDRAGEFDFYVLSLSWSPTYCSTAARPDRMQCGGSRPHAFVVHGLWPQYERGFPSDCRVTGRNPTRAQVDAMLDVMPSPGLVRHEWRKHGTCSGLEPRSYFDAVRAAAGKVVIPEAYRAAVDSRDLSPADVERAFVEANPQLRPSMIAVSCKGRLMTEVRICMTKDLAFRPCAEVDRRSCRAARVTLPATEAR
jgi:ribonuclease T2